MKRCIKAAAKKKGQNDDERLQRAGGLHGLASVQSALSRQSDRGLGMDIAAPGRIRLGAEYGPERTLRTECILRLARHPASKSFQRYRRGDAPRQFRRRAVPGESHG